MRRFSAAQLGGQRPLLAGLGAQQPSRRSVEGLARPAQARGGRQAGQHLLARRAGARRAGPAARPGGPRPRSAAAGGGRRAGAGRGPAPPGPRAGDRAAPRAALLKARGRSGWASSSRAIASASTASLLPRPGRRRRRSAVRVGHTSRTSAPGASSATARRRPSRLLPSIAHAAPGRLSARPGPQGFRPPARRLAVPAAEQAAALVQRDCAEHVLVRVDADDRLHPGLPPAANASERQAGVGPGQGRRSLKPSRSERGGRGRHLSIKTRRAEQRGRARPHPPHSPDAGDGSHYTPTQRRVKIGQTFADPSLEPWPWQT